jgi:SAM-dependent methyltransferase
MLTAPTCRLCSAPLEYTFVDLGVTPLSNAYLRAEDLNAMEPHYPLKAQVCATCFLVQVQAFEPPERIFSDYAYFSSYSESWLQHASTFTDRVIDRFELDHCSQVVEIASNDGYLLQYFKAHDIQVLGVEPAANVAQAAIDKGIPTHVRYFGTETARQMAADGERADLIVGNNVLAHVPDLNDFVAGMKHLLKPDGVITMEFPHLLLLIQEHQFDTIYHEHFSYFSLHTAVQAFIRHGLVIFDVDRLPTHGGSLRVYGRHAGYSDLAVSRSVNDLLSIERDSGLHEMRAYAGFQQAVQVTKRELLKFLIKAKQSGKRIAGYGAPAKGNTLLNFCGIRTDFIDYTVDRSPHKQGLFLPGTHIPIYAPDRIMETKPDYLLILPWNLKDEVMAQMAEIRRWGGRFLVPIPHVEVLD